MALARIDQKTARVCFRVDGCGALSAADTLRFRFIKRGRERRTPEPCPLRLCECPDYVVVPPPSAPVLTLPVAEIFADGRVCALVPNGWATAQAPGRYWVRLENDGEPVQSWCGQVEIRTRKARVDVLTAARDGCATVCDAECEDDSGSGGTGSNAAENRPLW